MPGWISEASGLEIAARLIFVAFFVISGLYNLYKRRVDDHVDRLRAARTPFPALTYWIAIVLQFAASALVLFSSGNGAVWGVAGMILFTALASFLLLRFWEVDDPSRRDGMRNAFLSNGAILAGLLLLLQAVWRP